MDLITPPVGASATVCLFLESEHVGGTELAMVPFLRALQQARWRPVLLHHAAPALAPLLAELAAGGIRHVEVRPLPEGPHGAGAIPALMRVLRTERPQVFHARLTSLHGAKFALVAAIAARVPAVVASVHAFPPLEMTRPALLQRRLLGHGVSRYVVASAHAARELHDVIPASRTRTAVIPNGVQAGRPGRAVDPAIRARLTAGGQRTSVLVPARLDDRKGHRFLFEAIRDVPGVQVAVAGTGPHRAQLERLAAGLGVADRVDFLGFRNDMAQLYAACDIVALPSLNEAFGNVVLEGMAATRPVVATRVGGPEEIVVDGVSGMLVPPADAQALGAALNRLIAEPQTARRMAIAGRRRAVECFSMERFAERWSRLYAELLPGQGDRRSHRSRRSANTAPVQSPTPTRGSSNGSLERETARSQTAPAEL